MRTANLIQINVSIGLRAVGDLQMDVEQGAAKVGGPSLPWGD
ncbi:hypothetical protein ACWGHM_30315 [Streptomyces sp. NPDC054904]